MFGLSECYFTKKITYSTTGRNLQKYLFSVSLCCNSSAYILVFKTVMCVVALSTNLELVFEIITEVLHHGKSHSVLQNCCKG